jgi:2-keto-3-deoxy-L-rhamnonate aldolase RhmA
MPELILAQPSCDMAMMRAYAAAGWRNVMLDLEHSPFAEADVVSASIGLASAGASLYLKMADRNAQVCTRYLQFGVRNFVLPNVQNAASVQAVRAKMTELFWVEPASIRLFPMIESRRGLHEIPAICAVEGVAGVLIGPGDLAHDLGFTFRTLTELENIGPELAPTLLQALDAIRACGKLNGSGFVRSWCKFFPMDRVDLVTLQLSDVASVNNLDIT